MLHEVFPIVFCGDVDHGKSTLLGRMLWETRSLTGEKMEELKRVSRDCGKDIEFAFLTDQFQEERREEKTIDTAQIFLKTRRRRYCLIDAPGHLEFIKNMMTGATQAQAAFLVIDATQGVKEQTKRHLHVLRMLGITQIGIVVNKMDLVDFSAHRFKQIKDAISGLFIQVGLRVIVVPVSAKKGDNILKMSKALGWYRGPTLMSICDGFSFVRQDRTGSLRLPIQDVYSIDGDNVYVGRLESGFVRGKQKVSLFPCGLSTQIRSLKIFGRAKMIARFGDNVGVILEDTLGVQRGEVICSMRDGLSIVCCFQGSLFWLAQNSLKVKDRVMVRCATQEVDGVVEEIKNSIDSSSLENRLGGAQEVKENELGVVIFKMEHPLVFDATGVTKELSRFAIEKDGKVCGFGIFSS